MIRLHGLTHGYRAGSPVLDGATIDLPSDRRLAVLGHEHSGKTTLIHLLSGLLAPQGGRIERFGRLSFPAGYQRGFRLANSGRQNVMFAARIYDADPEEVFEFVRTVSGYGDRLDQPLRDWAVQDRVSLSYILTYALPFDTYLFDNTIGPGLPEMRELCRQLFEARTTSAGAILATRQPRLAEQLCDCAVVIRDRGLLWFDDIREAIAVFEQGQSAAPAPAQTRDVVTAGTPA